MKIRIIKSLLSIYGAMVPGMTISVPDHIAKNWVKNKIAMAIDGAGNELILEPESDIPKVPMGMFWCIYCKMPHKLNSKKGKRHLKYSGNVA